MAPGNFEPFFSKHASTQFFKYGWAGSTSSGSDAIMHEL